MCHRKVVDQFGVEEACKVALESFVAADQFVAEAEARHESVLFEPEYGAGRAREENMDSISMCSNTLYISNMDVGSSLNRMAASTMT